MARETRTWRFRSTLNASRVDFPRKVTHLMNPTNVALFDIFLCTLGLSLSVSFGVWSRIRVLFLRQEFFRIRDDLWDAAFRLNAFDDPAYRDARSHINSVISSAPLLSIQSLMLASSMASKREVPISDNPDMNNEINKAMGQCADKIHRFVLWHKTSGWFTMMIVGFSRLSRSLSKQWVESDSAERVRDHSQTPKKPTGMVPA